MREKPLLFLALLLVLSWGAWSVCLTYPDEGRNAFAAREMLRSGDLVTPTFNGEPRLVKPPLLYYLMLPFMALIGPSELAARAPSILSAFALTLFLYLKGRAYLGERGALLASSAFALSPHVALEARAAVPEMTMVLFQFASLVLLLEGSGLLGGEGGRGKLALAWLASGLSVLAKGPVGFILPALSASLFALLRGGLRGFWGLLKAAFLSPGPLLFLAVVLPWYGAMTALHGRAFLGVFFLENNWGRWSGSAEFHPYPFWQVYLPTLLLAFWPWFPLLLGPAALSRLRRPTPFVLAMLVHGLVTVLFYGAAANKLHHYMLGSYPALFCAVAFALPERMEGLGRIASLSSSVLELLSGAFALLRLGPLGLGAGGFFLAAGGLWGIVACSRRLKPPLFALPRGLLISLGLVASAWLGLSGYRPDLAALHLGEGGGSFREEHAALFFYAGRPVRIYRSVEEVLESPPSRLFVKERDLEALSSGVEGRLVLREVFAFRDLDGTSRVLEVKGGSP